MNIILQGPQGSGKGTQAELLVQALGLNYFEAGKILRSIAASANEHSESIGSALNSGNLVPDEFMRLIAWDFVNKHDKTKGFIFDGYPRSVAQYEHLQDMLRKFNQKIDFVISIEISTEETVRRLSARRMCTKCGEIYNLVTKAPKNEICDTCGGELIQRADDQPEAIQKRLEIYRAQTHPVFEKAVEEGIGVEIDGERPIEVIHHDILAHING